MNDVRGGSRSSGAVLALLSSIYAINYIDRQILAVVLEPIKQDFRLSDSELGLLAGPAFALFYATMGLPIAMLADRANRARVIGWSLLCFSVATAACGAATSYVQLLLARVLTGIGEAGTGPASQSIITDLYPPERRGRAQAIYAVGVNIGIMIAFIAGGYIAFHHGWRMAFIAAGIPGLVLAPLLLRGRLEPARTGIVNASAPSLRECITFLKGQRAYCWIVLASGFSAFAGYGIATFVPSFLMRSHGMDTWEVGLNFAVILGIGGGIGTYFAGALVDRLSRRDVKWMARVPILAAVAALPFWPLFLLAGDVRLAIVAAVIPLSVSAVYIGPCILMIQALAPSQMRARAAAIQLFIGNLIGLGLGPQLIGVASDALAPWFGHDSLRYALLIGVAASVVAIFCYWRASLALKSGMARAAAG